MAEPQFREAHDGRVGRQGRNYHGRRFGDRPRKRAALCRQGAKLVLGDKTAAVHETAQLVKDAGGEAVALEIDAGVRPMSRNSVTTAKDTYGALDIAFANAGIIGDMGGIFDFDPIAWAETLRVNLIGPALMVKHAGKAMVDQGRRRRRSC